MDNATVKLGAQDMDEKSSKADVGSALEDKTEDEPSSNVARPEIEHAASKETASEQRDLDKVETDTQDPEPVKVPRSQRRGLFGRIAILAEVEEPKHYSRRAKWYITFIVSLTAAAAPLGSTIIFRMTSDQSTTAWANDF